MSSRYSRPRRTRMYDCNYDMSERYYKHAVDDLDRKYSTRGHIADAAAAADDSVSSLRSTLNESDSSLTSSLRRTAARAMEDREEEDFASRRPMSAHMEDYDAIFDRRFNSSNMSKSRALVKASEDENGEDETISNNLKRLRAARAARKAIEEESDTVITSRSLRPKLSDGFSEKVLNTVGLKHSDINKARLALADDSINRRVLKITTTTTEQSEDSPSWTRWSKMTDVDDENFDDQSFSRARKVARARIADLESEYGGDRASEAAAERARKSRARLADIEDEMETLKIRGAQREKRAADLKAFIQENEGSSDLSSSTTAKSSMKVKKFSSNLQSEKKTVTF